jgi:hypothetical protein
MTYPMEENNPKGQYKVKHRTHRIRDYIPSGHGNIKHVRWTCAIQKDKTK